MTICSINDCGGKVVAKGLCNKHYLRLKQTGTTADGPKAQAAPEVRFWSKVDKSGECWLWTGGIRPNGYGHFTLSKTKAVSAHRFSYQICSGQIPDGMVVMHECDVRHCVNPAHLRLGTQADNAHDMLEKNRHARIAPLGEDNGKSKLTADVVRYIRANPSRGHKELAIEIGVSPNTVRSIRIGRTWKHVK